MLASGRSKTVAKGGRNPEWSGDSASVIELPFSIRRGARIAMTVQAFDFEGDGGLKAKDDVIGTATADVSQVVDGTAQRGSRHGTELSVVQRPPSPLFEASMCKATPIRTRTRSRALSFFRCARSRCGYDCLHRRSTTARASPRTAQWSCK